MISIDRVYKTLTKSLLNSDVRGNVKPDELRLNINLAVEDIVNGYFIELNAALNRQNRGFSGVGLENVPDRIRERMLYFLKEADLTYNDPVFELPSDIRYIDNIMYYDTEVEMCKNNKEFKAIYNLADTAPTTAYPIGLKIGNTVKIAPSAIVDAVTISYLRKHLIANWTFVVIGSTEVFNPSLSDFQDIDLHPSEEYNVILKTLGYFGINLKEQDIIQVANGIQQQKFNQENAV